MRFYNVNGRAALGVAGGAVDIARASGDRFGPSPQDLYARWDEVVSWARDYAGTADFAIDPAQLGSPAPLPPQVFAIGLNYREHAREAALPIPQAPVVFTKFPASVTGPSGTIELPDGSVDFETELVAVIGTRADRVGVEQAWDHIAGLTRGQDLSERLTQWSGGAPQQFSLGKSFRGFTPMGPALLTPDEFADRDNVELGCSVNGVEMQRARSSDMIFSVADLVAYLSSVVPLLPGDVIFTGTPSGIGVTRDPQILLRPGDELVTFATSIGEMRHGFYTHTTAFA